MDEVIDLGWSSYQRLLMPYHFLSLYDYSSPALKIKTEYKTEFWVDDFFKFYENSGWYNVEKGEDYIIINGYNDEERVLELNNTLWYPPKHMAFPSPIIFQFKSTDEEGTNTFTVSYTLHE